MAKEIVIDIIDGGVSVSGDVQTGDTVAVIKAKNLPEEWLSDSTYVYALISQGENQALNLMQTETENSKTVKKCGVQSVFTANNKAFKIVIFGTNVEVGNDGKVSGSYRYVSAPVMVSVGEGLGSLTAEILPDKTEFNSIVTLFTSLQSAVEAEEVRAANEVKREEAEEARAGAEEIRASAEFERAEAEAERAKAESRRIESESIRADNEELRIGNEGQRIQNETARIEEEEKRESNENAREEAEEERKSIVKTCEISDVSELDDVRDVGLYKMYHNVYGASKYWLIVGYNDEATSSTFQLLIEAGGRISTRYYANNASFDDEGNPIYSGGWSDWQTIVDESRLDSRLGAIKEAFELADSIRITLWKNKMFYLSGEYVFATLSSGNAAVMEVTAPILVRGSDTPPDALPDFETNFKIIYTFGDYAVDQSYNADSENAQSGKAVAEAIGKIVSASPDGGYVIIDQSYNALSENAQSGRAVAEAIANLVNGSPEALDTLRELANALGNDENFSATVMEEIGKKVSSSDYATNDIAGVVKAYDGDHGSYGVKINSNGKLQLDCAYGSEIRAKVSQNSPITPAYADVAVHSATHKEMSDDYDVSTLTLCAAENGKQGQYPASYDATKGYVDSKIGDIETAIDGIIKIQNGILGVGVNE